MLNNVPTTIVGIMPRAFGGPHSRNNNDGWLPLGPGIGAESPVGCTARVYLWLFARVRQGSSFEATAEQAMLASGLERIPDADGKTGKRIALQRLDDLTTGDVRSSLLSLLGSVGLVLLIASANVANLQLERVFGRRRETAVRMAMLLVGAALLIQTFLTLRPDNPGFTTRDKLTASVRLQGPRAGAPRAFFEALFERVRALPGIQGITASTYLPVSGNVGIVTIRTGEKPLEVYSGIVLPNYFEEMEIPVVGGRAFDAGDLARRVSLRGRDRRSVT